MVNIAKTELTKQLERDIWTVTNKQGTFGCYEVTIGFNAKVPERVDYITYDTKGIWKCYEIKVSKEDFHSKAAHTFVGHYNYYIMTKELYEEVKDEIPNHIGVYIYESCVKKAKRQELKVDEQVLKDSMIRSLYREFEKQYKSEDETIVAKLNRSVSRYKSERNKYRKQLSDYFNGIYEEKQLLRFALKKLDMGKSELEDEYYEKEQSNKLKNIN